MSSLGFLFLYANFISRDTKVLVFAALLAAIGYALDAVWLRIGLFQMPGALPPVWLAILWFLFSLSLPFAFCFLRQRYLLCSLIGGFGGAFSYISAIALRSDVEFGFSIPVVFSSIFLLWAILFPLAFFLYEKMCMRVSVETSPM